MSSRAGGELTGPGTSAGAGAGLSPLAVHPSDRILLLSIPDTSFCADLAAQAHEGVVVGLGTDKQVGEARRGLKDALNVMFAPGSPAEIPWRDEFFTCVIEPSASPGWEQTALVIREIYRAMLPGGLLYVPTEHPAAAALQAIGFHLDPEATVPPQWLALRKPK
jgi:hypothetical protein